MTTALVAAVGLAYGASALFDGFFALSDWGPVAIGMLAVLFGLLVARPGIPPLPALVALGSLVFLWLWSYASTLWAESEGAALFAANRWMLYAAAFAVLILLVRDDRRGRILLGALTVGLLAVAAYVTVRLLLFDGQGLFLGVRLHEPLEYVNGQASYFLMGIWPLLAVAETARSRLVAGAALGGATLLGCLVFLCQTRAAVPAAAITAVALLALFPGRVRRGWALVTLAAGVAGAAHWLEGASVAVTGSGLPSESSIESAALAGLVASLVAGAAWALAPRLAGRLSVAARTRERLSAAFLAATVAVAVLVAVLAVGDPVDKVDEEWHNFTTPAADIGRPSTRLLSGSGQRYDYWRVAVDELESDPLKGVGAGNYPLDYFRERETQEPARQPHSLVLQTLGELGVVGALALLGFVLSVLAALWRRARAARADSGLERAVPLGAGGIFLVWLVHTSVDWLHIIPGLTGVALCAAATLFSPARAPESRPVRRSHPLFIAIAVSGLLLIFAAVSVNRLVLADRALSRGQDALSERPAVALQKADDALDLNPDLMEAYYLRAAAHARFDQFAEAREALLEATRREPHNFLPWALLGDLDARRSARGESPCNPASGSDFSEARRHYRAALALNPRDTRIADLARFPCLAVDSS